MQTIVLYRYIREDGGVTTSPIKPDGDYTEKVRLVADEGKGSFCLMARTPFVPTLRRLMV